MIRLLKHSLITLAVGTVAACGTLEPDVVPVSSATITPVITAAGKVVKAPEGTVADAGTNEASADLPASSLSPGSATGSVQQIYRTDRCNELSRGGFVWFTDTVGFDDFLTPMSSEEVVQVKSKVNFSKQGVLLVDYGIAGTGGAGSTLMNESLEIKGPEAIVKVKRNDPSSTDNKKRAQVVTHPCSLYVMPRTGFDTLVVHNEFGDRLTSFSN